VDGGIVLFGSPDASQPASLAGFGSLTLDTNLSLDVTGAASLGGGHRPFEPYQVTLASDAVINVAPGGTLTVQGFFSGAGAIHVASGTLDLSKLYSSYPGLNPPNPVWPVSVKMDDGAGTVVLGVDSSATVEGFRAGDVLDFRSFKPPLGLPTLPPYPPGPFQAAVNGDQLQISYNGTVIKSVTLAGPQALGATYQAVLSGANDLLVTTTAQPAATVAFADQTTGASGSHAMDAASGGPDYLQWQYLDAGSDTVAMAAGLPNVLLKGGAGTKALAASSGRNVLDGGTGSAILTGGTGDDTFFLDVRGTAQVWDTLVNFGPGDALTVWGWLPGSGTETVDPLDGAARSQGATLRLANAQGGPVSSVTFAGLSADQVARLQMSTGTAGGLSYLHVSTPGA
jgi:Ca2+-binding RTX toxin-like protein